MSAIVEEIRQAYATVGVVLDQRATYGTYYRLLCGGCGRMVGNVGDRLLPGMAQALVDGQFDLYAAGLLGCPCGHQQKRTQALDATRWRAGRERLGVATGAGR
ncbi:MAG: hypothetical protein HY294_03715 [Candidatus Rokubacteria bacterium]|nr:hypothetical protein [Candidatus Rokubacteria bacterium]MBI3825083.1 hypothetical protein [Candidatus Rokubacteria bacterium]